ncbi:hypothetical protein [Mesorhizobium cantuariense]|uniref:Glycosyltransferase RgtA/B/C/D-like domain-containing protein n=1 Tax=Mesorhizobium cantuariense TaxID=1300275 RepID=A0ABV7MP84_9HYPH
MLEAHLLRRWTLIWALSSLAMLGVVAAYVHRESPAYTWDYALYWNTFEDYGNYFATDPARALKAFLGGIWTQDYNPSGVLPLLPFYALFGPGRIVYVSAVALLYLLPTTLIATAVYSHMAKTTSGLLPIFLVALTFLPFWAPTLRGMLDIVGLVFLGLSTLLLFRSDFLTRRPVVNGLLLGLLIWLPFLFRRWYAYSVVMFFVVAFLVGSAKAIHERTGLRAILTMGCSQVIAGVVLVTLALAFQYALVVRAFTTSYSDLYSAYQVPFPTHLGMFASRFSPYMLALTVIGAIVLLANKSFEGAFCLMAAVGTFLLFIRTQQIGPHHFLPIAFWLLPLLLAGVARCAGYLGVLPIQFRLWPFAAIAVATFLVAIAPLSRSLGPTAHIFVPRSDVSPLHLDNYAEYERLTSDLERLTANGEKFVVYASTKILSDSLLLALDRNLRDRVIYAPAIANQDLFNFDALRSDFAVAATPPQEQQAPGSQANITIPGQWLLDRRGFGRAYERVGSDYTLMDGVRGYLFRRVRPVTLEEVDELVTELDRHYSGWGQMFRSSMAMPFAARNQTLGDQWGQIIITGPNTFLIHPGTNLPTSIKLPFQPAISRLPKRLNLSISGKVLEQCPTADGVAANVMFNEREIWSGVVLPGGNTTIQLPEESGMLSVVVHDRSQPSCDHAVATFEF